MKTPAPLQARAGARGPRRRSRALLSSRPAERGSVLIIVMWICLGLVALTLYFANSMNSELHAADNRVSEIAARQALEGGVRYAKYVLTQYAVGGAVPNIETNPDYKAEALPVGDASFWFIGRDYVTTDAQQQTQASQPYFALVDEASKLNLNTVTSAMLQALPIPNMTPDIADAIVAWRSANSQNALLNENYYTASNPPRHNKGAAYESTDELRLVNGVTLDLLFGEDTNRNGVLDANEDDGEASAPRDDQNGQLLAGLLEYVTIYSREPANGASGSRRINVTQLRPQTANSVVQRLTQCGISAERAAQIRQRIAATAGQNGYTSVADFMLASRMTADEWALVHTEFTAATGNNGTAQGLVNVNTACAAVLAAIPGIGSDNASTMVSYRAAHPDALTSFAWLAEVLSPAAIRQAGRYLTDQSYQFSADIAAVGSNGRGYCREKVVFDVSGGTPRIVYRQDLGAYGWALGPDVRAALAAPQDT